MCFRGPKDPSDAARPPVDPTFCDLAPQDDEGAFSFVTDPAATGNLLDVNAFIRVAKSGGQEVIAGRADMLKRAEGRAGDVSPRTAKSPSAASRPSTGRGSAEPRRHRPDQVRRRQLRRRRHVRLRQPCPVGTSAIRATSQDFPGLSRSGQRDRACASPTASSAPSARSANRVRPAISRASCSTRRSARLRRTRRTTTRRTSPPHRQPAPRSRVSAPTSILGGSPNPLRADIAVDKERQAPRVQQRRLRQVCPIGCS